jgi:very-short-patch-repair endonuclease
VIRLRQHDLLPSEFPTPEDFDAPKAGSSKTQAEDLFAFQCRAYRLEPLRQLQFAKKPIGRLWKFDFAFVQFALAVEIDGIVMRKVNGKWITGGAHANVQGMRDDNDKINSAILLGWSVLRFLQSDVKPGLAIETTMRVLSARGWKQT